MPLFDHKTKEITLSLIKANKCLDKLKISLKSTKPQSSYYSVKQEEVNSLSIIDIFSTSPTAEIFKKRCEEEFNKKKNLSVKRFIIQDDIYCLKSAIFAKNFEANVENIIAKIAFLNDRAVQLKEIKKELDKSSSLVYINDVDNVYESLTKNANSDINITSKLALFSSDELQNEMDSINKKLFVLEHERDKLNINNEIIIKLSEEACRIIGV